MRRARFHRRRHSGFLREDGKWSLSEMINSFLRLIFSGWFLLMTKKKKKKESRRPPRGKQGIGRPLTAAPQAREERRLRDCVTLSARVGLYMVQYVTSDIFGSVMSKTKKIDQKARARCRPCGLPQEARRSIFLRCIVGRLTR